MAEPIRVLVVDDSAFMRRVIGEAISSQPDLQLVGTAHNGLAALLKVEQLQPDVVTLDVEMPEMDGLTALRHLMTRYPRPVVMLSSMTQQGAATTLRALAIGAVDFVPKPSGSISLDFDKVREELLHKVRIAAGARVRMSPATAVQAERSSPPNPPSPWPGGHGGVGRPPRERRSETALERLVVIGSSTGGPRALGTVVPALQRDGRSAYVIVQHMPAGFTRSLAERLDRSSQLDVREASDGDHLAADTVLVAPGDHHLRLTSAGIVQLDAGPRLHGVRPSVDVTLDSAAAHFGPRTVVAILTGMGQDGAAGAVRVRQNGGFVLAEDESTCVVWGMPRAAVGRGAVNRVVPLDGIAEAIAAGVPSHA
jgi:two-component system chemotaxis response regulator CheB